MYDLPRNMSSKLKGRLLYVETLVEKARSVLPVEAGLWIAVAVALAGIVSVSLAPMDDFNNVYGALRRFVLGHDVYTEDYSTTDPHYLYSPAATVLLSPAAWIANYEVAHKVFSLVNGVSAVASVTIISRKAGLRGWGVPAASIVALMSPAFSSSIKLGNVNCLLLLVFVLFFDMLCRNRQIISGVLLGIVVVVKPMFAPIVVIALVAKYWKPVAAALVTYVSAAGIGRIFVSDFDAYREVVIPYVSAPRPYYNSAIRGLAADFRWSGTKTMFLMAAVAVAFLASVVVSYALWKANRLDWVIVMSAVTLAGVWLLSPLGQGYYSVFLTPVLFVAGRLYSPTHSALGACAFAGCFFPTNFGSYEANMLIATLVWTLFIAGSIASMGRFSYRRPMQEGSRGRHRAGASLDQE